MRELAATLCSRPDLDPRQVITVSCDSLAKRDLARLVTLANDLTRTIDTPDRRRRVWLIDEVGQIRGWTAMLKHLRDTSAFGDDTVIATASSWRDDEDVEGNLLAGRAGTSGRRRLRLLMPMTFRDFVFCTRSELALPSLTRPDDIQNEETRLDLDRLRFDVDAYDLAWQQYLTCGGFPRAVASHTRTGAVEVDYLKDLHAWLRTDVDPEAPRDSLPLLLDGISARCTSPLNTSKASKDLNYTRNVFERRINRLVNTFAAIWNPRRDDRGIIVSSAQAKLYLTDPILAWLPSHLRGGLDQPDFTKLTEQILAVALARAVDNLEEGRWVSQDTIGYSRTTSGNEIDLCPIHLPDGNLSSSMTTPIESKWVDQGWGHEARAIQGKYRRGVLATKSVLDTSGDVWAIPAPLLALLLG
jgi:predicted AAA+ superfamily ATPase